MLNTMLDYIRITLYGIAVLLAFFLYQTWLTEHPAPTATATIATSTIATNSPDHFAPAMTTAPASQETSSVTTTAPDVAAPQIGKIIQVKTDLFNVEIDTRGGDIIRSELLHYPESLGSQTPFLLFNNDKATRYIAESGLLSAQGPDTSNEQALYRAEQAQYILPSGTNTLSVNLYWQNAAGLKVTKIFTFTRGSYEVKVSYLIDNQTAQPWQGNLYTQLLRTNEQPTSNGMMMGLTTYFGAAVSTPQKPYEKITFKNMQEKNLNLASKEGWAAMIQHYFISAWVPPANTTSTYYSSVTPSGLYTIGMIGQPLNVAVNSQITTQTKLYMGPAIADQLEKTAPGLKLTIDYGWFWFISDIIFWMMQKIYDVIGNWGWSIVLVTIIIKLLFYQLSAKSYRSMSGLKKLQPRIEALKERFGSDRQKLTQATLELYRQEKVNPMSGCLPILIQVPVFIALYWVLVESVQLRQAPFIFWIHDLSQHDPFYVLPILMGLSMFVQQRLNPPPPDPTQAKVMMFMPLIFTVLFANFPAGLMLYWFVNNTLSFMQQWYVMHQLEKETNGNKRK